MKNERGKRNSAAHSRKQGEGVLVEEVGIWPQWRGRKENQEGSRRSGKLFERSEFFFFSSTFPYFSKIRAALIFCFFCIKAKEKYSDIISPRLRLPSVSRPILMKELSAQLILPLKRMRTEIISLRLHQIGR